MYPNCNVRLMVCFPFIVLLGRTNCRSLQEEKQNGGPLLQKAEQKRSLYGVPTSIYFFPWSCWVNNYDARIDIFPPYWPDPIGMCSIFNRKHVFAAVDNMKDMKLVEGEHSEPWKKLAVYWGADVPARPFDPSVKKSEVNNIWIALSPNVQTIRAEQSAERYTAKDWNNKSIQWDVIGAALNIAIMELKGEIEWTYLVQPMPILENDIFHIYAETESLIRYMNKHPHARTPCSIATYGPERSTVYLQVSYVPLEVCRSVYCSVDPGYCFNFPFQWYHVCFRSTTFSDPCKVDQGAALFCNWWDHTIFAILSQSDNCGVDGLPAVYTVMAAPLMLWSHVFTHGDQRMWATMFGRDADMSKYTISPDAPTPTQFGEG